MFPRLRALFCRPAPLATPRSLLQVESLEERQLLDGSGATVLRLDFDGPQALPAMGYTSVSRSLYSELQGFGWQSLTGLTARDRGTRDLLTRDFHSGYNNTFQARVANGTYDVTVALGDPLAAHPGVNLWAEGRLVASGISTAPGQILRRTFTVPVSDGLLNLRLTCPTNTQGFALNALEVIPSRPTASAGSALVGQEGAELAFSGRAGGAGPLRYSWDFGDGKTANNTLSPSHVYADNGTYTATLIVTDALGRSARSSTRVTVTNGAPTVTLTPVQGFVGDALTFRPQVSDPSPVDLARGFTYQWTFGDGAISTEASPQHVYSAAGTYSVQLTVGDKDGGRTTVQTQVLIEAAHDHPPEEDGDVLHTPHDDIPNYGATPNVWSLRSGSWSDGRTWSTGRVPGTGDQVAIMPGNTVLYDMVSPARLSTVVVRSEATLSFRTDVTTSLTVATLLVQEHGTLKVGTADRPVAAGVQATLIISDTPIDTTFDPKQYGTGLIGLGSVTLHGAARTSSYVRLAAEPLAGATTLTLAEPVLGWQPGDRLILPDTRQLRGNERDDRFVPQWEEVTLKALSADGRTITLTQALRFDHLGARDGAGVLRFLPHLADLTRNVVIRSENPHGTRGHVFLAHEVDVDIEYVAFRDLGRTTNNPLDSTRIDPKGNVQHIGTNQIGRYPLHIHHVVGPENPQANGYQFTLRGNAIDGGTDSTNKKWGIAIHDSHYGWIHDNVVYNVAGAGIITEDGSESNNVISNNYVVRVTGSAMRPDGRSEKGDFGHEGSGFWFRGPNNTVLNNVAANIVNAYGFTFYMGDIGKGGVVRVPMRPGADPSVEGEYRLVDMNATPLKRFERNEVYGATSNGMSLWYLGADIVRTRDIGESVIKDFTVWHMIGVGIYGYPNKNLTIDGVTILGNGLPASNDFTCGLFFSDYLTENLKVRRADIQGILTGILLPAKVGDTMNTGQQPILTTIEDSYFRCLSEGVQATTMWAITGGDQHLAPRETVLRNVRFSLPLPSSQAVRMIFLPANRLGLNLIQSDTFRVYDHNGVKGDHFQVYYKEQASDALVPVTRLDADGYPIIGAPEAGLTNAQAWAKYRVAIAGAVAPSKKTRAGIDGLVNPLTA